MSNPAITPFGRSLHDNGATINGMALADLDKLSRSISQGANPIQLWIAREHLSTERLTEIWSLSVPQLRAMNHDPDEPYRQLSGQQVLAFARAIGVHPAHLTICTDPAIKYALPHAIFKANLILANDKRQPASSRDLARGAVETELERFRLFVSEPSTSADPLKNKAAILKSLIDLGYRDAAIRQLDEGVVSDTSRYQLIPALMLEKLAYKDRRVLDDLLGQRETIAQYIGRADRVLDRTYRDLFGDVADSGFITAYVLNSLGPAIAGIETENRYELLTRLISADFNHVADRSYIGSYCKRLDSRAFSHDIQRLARVALIYLSAHESMDAFETRHEKRLTTLKDHTGRLEPLIEWISSEAGVAVRRLFANHAVMKPTPVEPDLSPD